MEKPVLQHPVSCRGSRGLCQGMVAQTWALCLATLPGVLLQPTHPWHLPNPHQSPVPEAVLLGPTTPARFQASQPMCLCAHP